MLDGTWTLTNGVLEETGPAEGRLLRTQVPTDLAEVRLAYRSDFDTDPHWKIRDSNQLLSVAPRQRPGVSCRHGLTALK